MMTGNDYYDQSPWIRYTLTIWVGIWVCVFLASGVVITNAVFRVDICEPQGGPCTGIIYSDLWSSTGWIATSLFGVNVFFIYAYFMILAFGRNRICAYIWVIVLVAAWTLGMVSWVLLLGEYNDCNKPEYPSNICTDLEACLVPEFFNSAASRCPNSPMGTRAYTLQLNQLRARADFLWLWGIVSAFTFVLNLAILIAVFVLWFGVSRVKSLKMK